MRLLKRLNFSNIRTYSKSIYHLAKWALKSIIAAIKSFSFGEKCIRNSMRNLEVRILPMAFSDISSSVCNDRYVSLRGSLCNHICI